MPVTSGRSLRSRRWSSQYRGRVRPTATMGAPNMTMRPPILVLSRPSAASGSRKSAPGRRKITHTKPSSPRAAASCQGWK